MRAILRFHADASPDLVSDLRKAIAVLAQRPGFVRGDIGTAIDDRNLVVMDLEFAEVGAYRRALSSTAAKMAAVPVLSKAIDEPSAYEVIHRTDQDGVHDFDPDLAPDGDVIGIGEGAPIQTTD